MSMRTAAAAAMPLPRSGTWPRRSCARSRNANCAGYDIWRFLPLRGLCLPPPEGEDCRDGETEQRPSQGFRDDDEREGSLRGRVGEDTKTGSRVRELLDRVVAHRRGQLFTALITPAIHRLTSGFASLAAARSALRTYR